jgi:hypothetical protein
LLRQSRHATPQLSQSVAVGEAVRSLGCDVIDSGQRLEKLKQQRVKCLFGTSTQTGITASQYKGKYCGSLADFNVILSVCKKRQTLTFSVSRYIDCTRETRNSARRKEHNAGLCT